MDEIRAEIFTTVDRMCLRVGELLAEARTVDPGRFRQWVEAEMPFSYDTASRLVAIHLAYRELPPEKTASLPRAWQALFALREHARSGRLLGALESGEVGPDTTVAEARKRRREWSRSQGTGRVAEPRYGAADMLAGRLMNHDPSEMDAHVLNALRRWVNRPETASPALR